MTTPSTSSNAKRDSLRAVREDIGRLATRLDGADKSTNQSVNALEAALRTLAQQNQDFASNTEGLVRQQQLDAHINALKTRLTHMIQETQKAVNSDLSTALNDPRLSTVAKAIDTANARLERAETEQTQNLATVKTYIATMAREIDETLENERADAQIKQKKLNSDIADCLDKIGMQEQSLSRTTSRLKTIETDTAAAIQLMGTRIVQFTEQASEAREEQSRLLKGEISNISLETQKNFDVYTDGLNRNIEALQTAHETAKHEFDRDLEQLRTRLETLEYGLSPNQPHSQVSQTSPSAGLSDAFTPTHEDRIIPHAVNISADDEDIVGMDDLTEGVIPGPRPDSTPEPMPTLSLTDVQIDAPIEELNSAPTPLTTENKPVNPYISAPSPDDVTSYNAPAVKTIQPHIAQQPVSPYQSPSHQDVTSQHEFYADPYSQLTDTQSADYGPVTTTVAEQTPTTNPDGLYKNMAAYDDMPYANPAYAENSPSLDINRPGGPVEISGGAKRSNFFTPSKLRAAMLGVAVLGIGYTAVNLLTGNKTSANQQEPNVFVESEPTDLTSQPISNGAKSKSAVQSVQPIGTYTDTIERSASDSKKVPSAIASAAQNGDPAAEYQLGLAKLQSGDTDEALKLLRAAANKGQPAAQYRLAKLYETGNGVTQDLETARSLIDQAARSGNRIAMHDLANFYANGIGGVDQDLTLAAQWFEKAAERGVVDSQYNIGYLYEFGFGVAKNQAEAYVWYGIASNQGDSEAAKRIAVLTSELSEVEIDSAKARITGFKPVKINKSANGIFGNTSRKKTANAAAKTADTNAPQIVQVQSLLNDLGYSAGSADGQVGAKTRHAIIAFEKANGLPETGRINSALVQHLELAAGA